MIEPLRFKHELERALGLIAELDSLSPVASLPESLHAMFQQLRSLESADTALEVEDEIWEAWTNHDDADLADRMQHAIAAISQQAWGDAEAVLNELIRDVPQWPEAWNKRAQLFRLIERDVESVTDIQRTLRLEPRHFGALKELGQICIRHDEPETALFAFDAALRVNPHLDNIRSTAESLRTQVLATLN